VNPKLEVEIALKAPTLYQYLLQPSTLNLTSTSPRHKICKHLNTQWLHQQHMGTAANHPQPHTPQASSQPPKQIPSHHPKHSISSHLSTHSSHAFSSHPVQHYHLPRVQATVLKARKQRQEQVT
jgi:hypothetical protein